MDDIDNNDDENDKVLIYLVVFIFIFSGDLWTICDSINITTDNLWPTVKKGERIVCEKW